MIFGVERAHVCGCTVPAGGRVWAVCSVLGGDTMRRRAQGFPSDPAVYPYHVIVVNSSREYD